LLVVAALWCSPAYTKPPLNELTGVVSIADGDPFTIIRRDTLETGTKGVTVVAGDIIDTGPGAFLVIELSGGNLVGIGPSTQMYILQRTDLPTLIVLKGWVKVDLRAGTKPRAFRVVGTRMGIQSQRAVIVLFADERSDAIFDEQGSAMLLLREDAATRAGRNTEPNQFFVREAHQDVLFQPRPSSDFVSRMPIPFRDPLPEKASAKLKGPAEPKLLRDVTYSDIQTWLTIPRDWRSGFIARFRGRLRDPSFFSAMDAHLAQHSEWTPILHPPPPSEDEPLPVAARPGAPTTPH